MLKLNYSPKAVDNYIAKHLFIGPAESVDLGDDINFKEFLAHEDLFLNENENSMEFEEDEVKD